MPTITVTAPAEVGSGTFALVANTEHVIDFNRDLKQVEIGVENGTAPVYVSVVGTAAVVGAKNCYPIPTGTSTNVLDVPTAGNTKVRLITAGSAPTVWVVRASEWNVADDG